MSSVIITARSPSDLTPDKLAGVLEKIAQALAGRVDQAFVFGSASAGAVRPESDIDLILVKKGPLDVFPRRGHEFLDLFEIFPRLDLLVYAPEELAAQLADSKIGFWRSARESMRRIV